MIVAMICRYRAELKVVCVFVSIRRCYCMIVAMICCYRAVMKASCDPYTEQKTLCLTLSNYLRRHYGIVTPPTSTDDADQHPAVPMSVSPGICRVYSRVT